MNSDERGAKFWPFLRGEALSLPVDRLPVTGRVASGHKGDSTGKPVKWET